MVAQNSTILYSWAKELKAIVFSLEHRYFGESAPFGAKDPVTQPKEFEFLTLDNVMADGVRFLDSLKQNITGAENSKCIVASGELFCNLCRLSKLLLKRPRILWWLPGNCLSTEPSRCFLRSYCLSPTNRHFL